MTSPVERLEAWCSEESIRILALGTKRDAQLVFACRKIIELAKNLDKEWQGLDGHEDLTTREVALAKTDLADLFVEILAEALNPEREISAKG